MTAFRPRWMPMLSKLSSARSILRQRHQLQRLSTKHSPKRTESEPRARSRLANLNRRLPRFLQGYTTPLLSAPITHVVSFLVLHELTAVVPLFALFGVFHYTGWTPSFSTQRNVDGDDQGAGSMTAAFDEGVRKFGKWLRKRGWVEDDDTGQRQQYGQNDAIEEERGNEIARSDRGTDMIVQFAASYAITKALLPIRIAGSVWATPWFARSILVPFREWMSSLYRIVRR